MNYRCISLGEVISLTSVFYYHLNDLRLVQSTFFYSNSLCVTACTPTLKSIGNACLKLINNGVQLLLRVLHGCSEAHICELVDLNSVR